MITRKYTPYTESIPRPKQDDRLCQIDAKLTYN